VSEIVWEDPSPRTYSERMVWVEVLEPLTQRPQVWARIKTCATAQLSATTANNLRCGRLRLPPGDWEFRASKKGDIYGVYARYLGPVESVPLKAVQ